MTKIDEFLSGILEASRQLGASFPNSPHTTVVMDHRHELICLELYDKGWIQDGFDYVPETFDIITYWKKEGEEKKQVQLTLKQQQRWVRELEKRKKRGKI